VWCKVNAVASGPIYRRPEAGNSGMSSRLASEPRGQPQTTRKFLIQMTAVPQGQQLGLAADQPSILCGLFGVTLLGPSRHQ